MEKEEVLEILKKTGFPVTRGFDFPPFDLSKPQLRFRGGEHGKIHSSIRGEFYMGDWEEGVTYCAYTMHDAMGFSSRRSNEFDAEKRFDNDLSLGKGRDKGGRYDPKAGHKLEGFRYGFPFLLTLDGRRYRKNFNSKIGDVEIREPISLNDIVVLFDKEVNLICEVPKNKGTDFYLELVERRRLAFAESQIL